MRRVSKRITTLVAACALVLIAGGRPAFAAPKGLSDARSSSSFIRTVIRRILDLTDIRFPPG